MIVDPKEVSVQEFHKLLLGTVAPRPIAFVSTVDKNGNVNLSPFSFFNCFSANPPVLVFSPSRRVRDNTVKHTLENAQETGEVVINVVTYSMVEQASLASTEYERGVNEFLKSGFTEEPSLKVKPPRVKESPVSFECLVKQIIPLGTGKGAGNLIICEVVLAHCSEIIFNEKKSIDPDKIDLVSRMGDNFYSRASGTSIFEVAKPVDRKGIGVDAIPHAIRNSDVLTGNNLGRLGNVEKLPSREEIERIKEDSEVEHLLTKASSEKEKHLLAKKWIEAGRVEDAWKLLLLKQ